MRPVRLGFLLQLLYLLYVVFCIARAIVTDDANTQVAAAFWSFPASLLAFSAAIPVLDWLGPYGDPSRRIAEWLLLVIAGGLQYFALGYFAGTFLLRRH
jgi:hypothetical protein